eukprot:COSAG02_NODE_46342_length_349_cov_2.020000_1_plen_31_part_10
MENELVSAFLTGTCIGILTGKCENPEMADWK